VEFFLFVVLGPRAAMRDPVPWIMAAIWAGYVASLPLLFPNWGTYGVGTHSGLHHGDGGSGAAAAE
jgi:hypothetical protein